MKFLISFVFVLLLLSCTKDGTVNGNGMLLSRVTADNKTHESFQFNSEKQLTTYKYFGHCETNPMDEDNFLYDNKQLKKIESVMRSHYSSTTATCDPASGISSQHIFEYNANGRLIRITRPNSFGELVYNAKGWVEKLVLNAGGLQSFYFFEYDSRGNIIKQTDPQGTVIVYEYDDKFNPYYLIKHRPNLITAFNSSPDNVTKGTSGGYVFTRQFEYNSAGLPVKLTESTTSTVYRFEYR